MLPHSEATLGTDGIPSGTPSPDFVLTPDQLLDLGFFQTILEFIYSVTDLIVKFFT